MSTPAAAPVVTTVTARLARLVEEVRDVVDRGLPPDLTAYLVGERLAPHLGAPDLLTARQCEGDPDHYRQHILHAEPDGGFSIVALVWLPGQRTAIHDHVAWCVTGCTRARSTSAATGWCRTGSPPGSSRRRTS